LAIRLGSAPAEGPAKSESTDTKCEGGNARTIGLAASGPELLANVNPTFEWVRLAQRIPTRIHIDDVSDGVRISTGMTCTVVVAAPAREWAIPSLIRSNFGRFSVAHALVSYTLDAISAVGCGI
jgi:hypothetical protein